MPKMSTKPKAKTKKKPPKHRLSLRLRLYGDAKREDLDAALAAASELMRKRLGCGAKLSFRPFLPPTLPWGVVEEQDKNGRLQRVLVQTKPGRVADATTAMEIICHGLPSQAWLRGLLAARAFNEYEEAASSGLGVEVEKAQLMEFAPAPDPDSVSASSTAEKPKRRKK